MAGMPPLLADLDALYLEHRRCGELEAEISEGERRWIVNGLQLRRPARAADHRRRVPKSLSLRVGTHASHRQAEMMKRLVFMLQLAESSLTSMPYRQILGAPQGPPE
jgi:hypothetical protein